MTFATPAFHPPPAGRVDLYVKANDATVWAIKTLNGKPLRAIGPLSPSYLASASLRFDFGRESIDARGWGMGAFTVLRRGLRIGPQAPCPKS